MSDALKAAYRAQKTFLDVIAELQALATSTRIPRSGNSAGLRLRPSIAVTLDLAQVGKGTKTARDGTLKITVGPSWGCQLYHCCSLHCALRVVLVVCSGSWRRCHLLTVTRTKADD